MQLSATRKQAAPAARPARLARQLAGFFRYVTLSCDGPFLQQVSELDLSLSQLKTLSLLDDRNGEELSVKELAEELGISLPAASRAVDPLVRRRLVARNEDPNDRRIKRVRLTARGEALVQKLTATRAASLEQVLAGFSESERRKLGTALDAVLERPEIARYYRKGVAGR